MSQFSNLLGAMLAGQAAAMTEQQRCRALEQASEINLAERKAMSAQLEAATREYRAAKYKHLTEIADVCNEIEALVDTMRSMLVKYVEQRYEDEVKPHDMAYREAYNKSKADLVAAYTAAGEIINDNAGNGRCSSRDD
jgi:hypothetical protein